MYAAGIRKHNPHKRAGAGRNSDQGYRIGCTFRVHEYDNGLMGRLVVV